MRFLDEVRAALKDPRRPLPPAVWGMIAGLVSMSLFLTLRLVVMGTATVASGIEPEMKP